MHEEGKSLDAVPMDSGSAIGKEFDAHKCFENFFLVGPITEEIL